MSPLGRHSGSALFASASISSDAGKYQRRPFVPRTSTAVILTPTGDALMDLSSASSSQTRQRKVEPRPTFGGSGGLPSPEHTSNTTSIRCRSTTGWSHACSSDFLDSHNVDKRGMVAPQAGLGHVAVRVQSHAMTVASPPPCVFGSRNLGYK